MADETTTQAETGQTAPETPEGEEFNLEMLPFQIIANVGTARSMYVEAVEQARAGDTAQAHAMLEEGETYFVTGHDSHLKIFTHELTADDMKYLPLIIHAEDQLMSAEGMKIVCDQLVAMQEEILQLRDRLDRAEGARA